MPEHLSYQRCLLAAVHFRLHLESTMTNLFKLYSTDKFRYRETFLLAVNLYLLLFSYSFGFMSSHFKQCVPHCIVSVVGKTIIGHIHPFSRP